MKTKIKLSGLASDSLENIETFEGTEEQLKTRLLELQKGYCEGEKPYISEWETNRGNRVIEAHCESDFSYLAIIK